MVWNNRYIDVNENGMVVTSKNTPTENSIDTIDMVEPEMPTDAIYALYYNEEKCLYWVKVADFEPETPEEPTDNVTWDSMAQAISEGVNEV